MGQNVSSAAENFIPDTVETIQYEVSKQVKILTEINDLTYDNFHKSLMELNNLSKQCFQHTNTKLVFAVKKSSDESLIWKATVRIACVKVDTASNKIESYKLLNLKQFIRVFKTMQSHLEVMTDSENQTKARSMSASSLLNQMESLALSSPENSRGPSTSSGKDQFNECCICLDRKPEILLPCTHTYCCPCIEQWNVNNKTCPICQEKLQNTDETWVLSELPDMQEINEEIYTELIKLSKD